MHVGSSGEAFLEGFGQGVPGRLPPDAWKGVRPPSPMWGLRRLYTAWRMGRALFPALRDLKPRRLRTQPRRVPFSHSRRLLLTVTGLSPRLTVVPLNWATTCLAPGMASAMAGGWAGAPLETMISGVKPASALAFLRTLAVALLSLLQSAPGL